jgi:hypothetical protein
MVASHQREPGLLGTVSVVINGAIDTSLCGPLPVVVTKAARSLGWATMNEVLAGLRTVGFALRRVFFAMVTSYLNNGVTPERVSTSSCGEGKATPHQLMAQFPNHSVKVGMPRSWISCFIEMVGPEKCPCRPLKTCAYFERKKSFGVNTPFDTFCRFRDRFGRAATASKNGA